MCVCENAILYCNIFKLDRKKKKLVSMVGMKCVSPEESNIACALFLFGGGGDLNASNTRIICNIHEPGPHPKCDKNDLIVWN